MEEKHAHKKNSFKIIPLGGVEEIGINCTLIEYDEQIIVIDIGMGFSEIDHLGVDYLIPNYEYLVKNKKKIEGIFITHGHLDHIGGIAYFLEKLDYPDLFASPFAMELIKNRLSEAGILDKAKLHVINADSVLKSKDMNVSYFRVTHSIPESMGVIVKTPAGTIVHSGDFKFDNSPLNEPTSEFHKLAKISAEGVDVLISDSTNAFREGHSISETKIKDNLEEIIRSAKGRVIVATFSSLVTRLYALTEIAKTNNRKIFITGRSMQQSFDVSRKLNYINAKEDLFTDNRNYRKLADDRLMVLATGSQGENMAALARMARGDHRDIKIQKGDTVILSSSIIPGNDVLVQHLIDELSQLGAKVVHQDMMNVHTSGHGFQEDLKWMLNLVKPKYFIPVHGYQYFLHKHAELAVQTGVRPENIFVAKRGEIVKVSATSIRSEGVVKNNPILISGAGVGDVGPIVLQDREQLAQGGMVVINMLIKENDKGGKTLIKKPTVISRGFVFMKESKELIAKLQKEAEEVFQKYSTLKGKDFYDKVRFESERHLKSIIFTQIGREPLIMVNVENVDGESAPAKDTN